MVPIGFSIKSQILQSRYSLSNSEAVSLHIPDFPPEIKCLQLPSIFETTHSIFESLALPSGLSPSESTVSQRFQVLKTLITSSGNPLYLPTVVKQTFKLIGLKQPLFIIAFNSVGWQFELEIARHNFGWSTLKSLVRMHSCSVLSLMI